MALELLLKTWGDEQVMPKTVVKCSQKFDELGTLEEFTNDLIDISNVDDMSYLSSEGLAKIGTRVQPGMILIGKVGQRKEAGMLRKMNAFEQLIATRKELRTYLRQRLYDASVYASSECFGVVVDAYFELDEEGRRVAVIMIESP